MAHHRTRARRVNPPPIPMLVDYSDGSQHKGVLTLARVEHAKRKFRGFSIDVPNPPMALPVKCVRVKG